MYNNSLNNNDIEHSLYFSLLNPYLEYEPEEDDNGKDNDVNKNDGNNLQQRRKKRHLPKRLFRKLRNSFTCQPQPNEATKQPHDDDNNIKFTITLILMIILGSANKVFTKLQAIPLYNYPLFLNLYTTFIYIPLCFLYIIPLSSRWYTTTTHHSTTTTLSHAQFIVMGILDSIASFLQTFASVYLPGSYLIILPQAAIPLSMAFSRCFLQRRYRVVEYVGAVIVIGGLCIVLSPVLTQRGGGGVGKYICVSLDGGDQDGFGCSICRGKVTKESCLSQHHFMDEAELFQNDFDENQTDVIGKTICQWISYSDVSSSNNEYKTIFIWSLLMIVSIIPMTLSSIYKEQSLSSTINDLDPIYLNGWISFYQFFCSVILTIPAGYLSTPMIPPMHMMQHLVDGFKCYIGIGSISSEESFCHADDQCHLYGPLFVNLYLCFNIAYNILLIYILKFASSNVLYLALTIMIPVGNLVFALPFVPGGGGGGGMSDDMMVEDVLGLVVLMGGLVLYRFGDVLGVGRRWKDGMGYCCGKDSSTSNGSSNGEGSEDDGLDLQESNHKDTMSGIDQEGKRRHVNLISSLHDDCLLIERSHDDDIDQNDDKARYHLLASSEPVHPPPTRIPPASSFLSLLQPQEERRRSDQADI